jgi:hypothetical protein
MLVTFPSRKMWSEHELMQHLTRQSWKCQLCSNTFTAENILAEHLQLTHDLSEQHCKLLVASSPTESLGPRSAKDEQCPLCLQKGWTNRCKFITHKGRHLEEIALSVLPREFEADSDGQSDPDEILANTNALQPPFPQDLFPREPGEDELLIQHPSHSLETTHIAAWSAHDDEVLVRARTMNMAWNAIHEKHFPTKTSNACRKRYERLRLKRGGMIGMKTGLQDLL